MRTDMVRDHDYAPTARELLWLEKLARVARAAMAYSEDMVGAVIVYQQASLAAVDVTWGVATHADLRQVAEDALDEIGTGIDSAQVLPEGDNALSDGANPPRKERAA